MLRCGRIVTTDIHSYALTLLHSYNPATKCVVHLECTTTKAKKLTSVWSVLREMPQQHAGKKNCKWLRNAGLEDQAEAVLSYGPYGPSCAFIVKLLTKSPYEGCTHFREKGRKSRTAMPCDFRVFRHF